MLLRQRLFQLCLGVKRPCSCCIRFVLPCSCKELLFRHPICLGARNILPRSVQRGCANAQIDGVCHSRISPVLSCSFIICHAACCKSSRVDSSSRYTKVGKVSSKSMALQFKIILHPSVQILLPALHEFTIKTFKGSHLCDTAIIFPVAEAVSFFLTEVKIVLAGTYSGSLLHFRCDERI